MFEGEFLFSGQHPAGSGYSPEAHLVELIAALGPPPLQWLEENPATLTKFTGEGRWSILSSNIWMASLITSFSGHWIGEIPIPGGRTLESKECRLSGEEQKEFLRFVRSMLQWRPEDRMTAEQLLDHPWLNARQLCRTGC